MVLHLAGGLIASLDSVNGFAGGTLQAAILVAIVVHGDEALEVVLVTTLSQAAHRFGPGDATYPRTLVARRSRQRLHADGAVLKWDNEFKLGFCRLLFCLFFNLALNSILWHLSVGYFFFLEFIRASLTNAYYS